MCGSRSTTSAPATPRCRTCSACPVTAVKIDKSFVEPLLRDDTARAIVHAVVDLAHSLRLSVIAEGVDSAAVMEQLTALGCDALQGFYVAIPMSPDRLEQWIAATRAAPRPATSPSARRQASAQGELARHDRRGQVVAPVR